MRSPILIAVVAATALFAYLAPHLDPDSDAGRAVPTERESNAARAQGGDELARAFAERRSDLIVEGTGTVLRVLPDDRDGDRHQRFILSLDSGQTLLVAHNIDLAPRVPSLSEGDTVAFKGEYEWNAQGGVLHWTHHDPAGRHVGGWLRHRGATYQ